MGLNRPRQDLGEILMLAMEDLDETAAREGTELPLPVRTRIVHWLARAYDAGRFSPRDRREP